MDWQEALERLRSGDSEYISHIHNPADLTDAIREDTTLHGQHPYAVVITCSDSRVPVENIFSVGIGELFVIRTAGNVVAEYELGSVEYAVEHLSVPLVVVMGHTHCGAVEAAMLGDAGGYVGTITHEIRGCIGDCRDASECEKLNVRNTVKKIQGTEIMQELISEGKVHVVGAIYDIRTGKVKFM
jgi:carbonic anhydrase